MKSKIFALLLALSIAFSCANSFVSAASTTLSMDKTSYSLGEAHTVTYENLTGNNPWWGVYYRNDVPGSINVSSVFWSYMQSGSGTINFNNTDADSSKTWNTLDFGEYKLCLFSNEDIVNGGYVVQAQFNFDVTPSTDFAPPKSIVYNRTATTQGLADGTITINDDANRNITSYALYWGDNNGKFNDYTPIIVTSNKSGTSRYTFSQNTVIPEKSTRLYAYSRVQNVDSQKCVYTELPKNCAINITEKPYLKFEVLSDLHIESNSSAIHNQHFIAALKDINKTAPDSDTIVFNGDLTDFGQTAQYTQLQAIINHVNPKPEITYVVGNHELRDNTGYDNQIARFKQYTGVTSPYYKKEFKNCTFIILGSEATAIGEQKWNHSAHISDTQFNWLETTLKSANIGSKPIFLFVHQPLKNTVSGSLGNQDWDGIRQDSRLRAILEKYPQVTMFSGHTHWELDSKQPFYNGKGLTFSAFNDASVGYLWTDSQQHKVGSQGLYVEVYKDKILVKGRDFETGCWVSAAQFMVDITLNIKEKAKSLLADSSKLLANETQLKALNEQINELSDTAKASLSDTSAQLTSALKKIATLKQQSTNSSPTIKNSKIYKNGKLLKSQLVKIGNKTYCADKNGNVVKNKTYKIKNKSYAFNKTGVRVLGTKFVTLGGKKHFVKSGVVVCNKAFTYKNKTYVANSKGRILSGNKVVKVPGKSYYVNKKGVVSKNCFKKYKSKWYYANKKGVLYKNTTKKINGKKYKFDKNCVCKNK